jgi:hypothetical protein
MVLVALLWRVLIFDEAEGEWWDLRLAEVDTKTLVKSLMQIVKRRLKFQRWITSSSTRF